ncbi:uncharacterized protein LOC135171101 isoform X2 [Diachasmimorpha longicaudata]|uniref:uncharacterized protein LOC135171101 isoform X2 n=1 Tax=Diachasmimorpha longicaudata TaxID=58733 RepID=UPI0030B872F4
MALPLAIALAGLKLDDYGRLVSHLAGQDSPEARAPSPSNSDSSGICSLATSATQTTPSSTPLSSRPQTPNDDSCSISSKQSTIISSPKFNLAAFKRNLKNTLPDRPPEIQLTVTPDNVRGKRDVHDLMGNIRDSRWNLRHPDVYDRSIRNFMEYRSIYSRLGTDGLTEEYPVEREEELVGNVNI